MIQFRIVWILTKPCFEQKVFYSFFPILSCFPSFSAKHDYHCRIQGHISSIKKHFEITVRSGRLEFYLEIKNPPFPNPSSYTRRLKRWFWDENKLL